jgi:NADPH:quinone reductase-like Zn-dependent oxidoreductase
LTKATIYPSFFADGFLKVRGEDKSIACLDANAFYLKNLIVLNMKMKAIITTRYGSPDVLEFKDVEEPAPMDDEALVKVKAASVNPMDWHLLEGKPVLARLMIGGFLKPKNTRPGSDIAGRVETVGSNAKEFQPGDEVFGAGRGSFAEYACIREDALVLKPANVSFEEAAAVPVAAITALQGLRDKGEIHAGQRVLINGASGGVGTFAVQIAKSFGAEVTGVCSTANLNMVRLIGADHVIDYTQVDFTKKEQRYDLILATAGYHSIFGYMRALSTNGVYVFVGSSHLMRSLIEDTLLGPLISRIESKKIRSFIAKINKKDLVFLKDLIEAGKVKPVIDKRYPLSQVPDALRYLEEGHAKGKVVITVGNKVQVN